MSTYYYSRISGWGMYAPERVLTNAELAAMVDTSDEWIRSRTGISERRIAAANETTVDMSLPAARAAIARAGITPADLDLIILATSSPDYVCPPASSLLQDRLGAGKIGAFTLVAGCSGFVYGLAVAAQFVQTGMLRHVLVVGAEKVSYAVDWEDRNTNVLFGDGAGAVVVSRSDTPGGLQSMVLGSDGADWDALIVPGIGSAQSITHEGLDRKDHKLKMDGKRVFKFATRAMTDAVVQMVSNAGLSMADIDWLLPHQANDRIIDLALRRLGFPREKTVINLDRYGNTSAASVPLALCEALDDGRIQPGDTLCMIAFGAGLTYAGCVWEWQPERVSEEPILISNWPVPESLQSAAQQVRSGMWRMQVQARAKASDAAMAVMLPLYAFRKGVKKRLGR
ncbi:MAG: ketoacyl-ACP synthase III [Caldilineales bacterium]|nr:ketoacyl-ACP synthase III [Caldilineales bacterium]